MKGIIFIFSLPRSGSTLLQRMIMSHPEIHSISEPWLLLPLAYMSKGLDGVQAPYSHSHAQDAMADLIENLPRKMDDYHDEIKRFTSSIYEKACYGKNVFFLDKTPRYYLVIPFIEKVFPDAKFIFLYRNPLSVMASMINTWGGGRLGNLHRTYIDLYKGPACLAEGWRKLKHKSVKLSYEMLVRDPDKALHHLSEYLRISLNGANLTFNSANDLMGKMGDKTGINQYHNICVDSLDKWKSCFNSKFRIWYAHHYLKIIGADVLDEIGYPIEELTESLNRIPGKQPLGGKDLVDFVRMQLYIALTGEVARKSLQKILVPGLLTWKWRHQTQSKKK